MKVKIIRATATKKTIVKVCFDRQLARLTLNLGERGEEITVPFSPCFDNDFNQLLRFNSDELLIFEAMEPRVYEQIRDWIAKCVKEAACEAEEDFETTLHMFDEVPQYQSVYWKIV